MPIRETLGQAQRELIHRLNQDLRGDLGRLTNSTIARRLGLDTQTVRRVLREGGAQSTGKQGGRGVVGKGGIRYFHRDAPFEWCAVCRTRVRKPCLLCQLRRLRGELPETPQD